MRELKERLGVRVCSDILLGADSREEHPGAIFFLNLNGFFYNDHNPKSVFVWIIAFSARPPWVLRCGTS